MDLFVFGTLRARALMEAVAGGVVPVPIVATLPDYIVQTLADDVVPHIGPRHGAVAQGVLYRGLDAVQVHHLDLFEGAFGYTLHKVVVTTSAGAHVAQVYLPPMDALAEPGPWSLEHWENKHLAPMLHAVQEVFAHDPLPDQAALRRMWPMIEKRAWAKHRAATEDLGPATIRYQPQPGDVDLHTSDPPLGGFFRLQGFEVEHRQFDGTRSGDLRREVFLAVDAVMILPYDAKRDRILLVEQIRMGPLLRGDPNPWSLEPIAGMVDARETPLEAGIRESMEEAGLEITQTERMMAFYAAPGGTTDYFTCYLGLCDLPEQNSYTGGLATESEDLRLHTLDFQTAFDLIQTGEINAGPLITMLYWLDRERARLRATA